MLGGHPLGTSAKIPDFQTTPPLVLVSPGIFKTTLHLSGRPNFLIERLAFRDMSLKDFLGNGL